MIPTSHLRAALQILRASGETTLCPISGDCMAPLLRAGDSVLIQYGNRDIRRGDVVVFGSPGDLCIHRVVAAGSKEGTGTFIVKGDMSADVLPPVSRDQILGKVIEARGSNGHIRFQSAFWRAVNYFLWLRSYVWVRRLQTVPVSRTALNALILLRARLLPRQWSISLLPIRAVCGINKAWTGWAPSRLGTKGEG